jgi:carbon starvation protein
MNQILAGMVLLVITLYLAYKRTHLVYTIILMVFVVFMTGWAQIINLRSSVNNNNRLLFFVGTVVFILEIWIVIESISVLKRIYCKRNKARYHIGNK